MQDDDYQRNIAEYTRLQSRYEQIHETYLQAESAFFAEPLNNDKKTAYRALQDVDKEAFDEFNKYSAAHPDGDGRQFTLDCLKKLVISALIEQYKLTDTDAEDIWYKYIEENSEMTAMLFLSCVGAAWLTEMSEDDTPPFMQARMKRIETENNRRIGLNKINK